MKRRLFFQTKRQNEPPILKTWSLLQPILNSAKFPKAWIPLPRVQLKNAHSGLKWMIRSSIRDLLSWKLWKLGGIVKEWKRSLWPRLQNAWERAISRVSWVLSKYLITTFLNLLKLKLSEMHLNPYHRRDRRRETSKIQGNLIHNFKPLNYFSSPKKTKAVA